MEKKHTIFITGAAGYIGTMLVMHFSARDDVEKIIGLDKEPIPDILRKEPKLVYLCTNVADDWEEKVRGYHPDIIIHTAWQIREMYGAQDMEWDWNIGGSDKVFDYALGEKEITRLIHFSTVASYGAYPSNTIEHRYTEDEPFRKMEYLYSEEKRVAEEHLKEKYQKYYSSLNGVQTEKNIAIVRPAAVTGPRGRFMKIRFGLQSALSGQMKNSFIYRLISVLVTFVPVTPRWLRQFIHEDDVAHIIERLAFDALPEKYIVFNICPPGPVVLGTDMGKAVGKRKLLVYPWMVRIVFFWVWHLTQGKIPTSPGSWKGYSYPIAVDGSKITRVLGYKYKYTALEAFQYTNGTYESYVPENMRRHKTV